MVNLDRNSPAILKGWLPELSTSKEVILKPNESFCLNPRVQWNFKKGTFLKPNKWLSKLLYCTAVYDYLPSTTNYIFIYLVRTVRTHVLYSSVSMSQVQVVIGILKWWFNEVMTYLGGKRPSRPQK